GARARVRAGPASRRGVGCGCRRRRPDGGRPRQGAAAQARRGRRGSQAPRNRARRRLPPEGRAMNLPRHGLLAVLTVVFLVGLALTVWRLIESRRSGLSFRLQVFLPLAATTLTLSAAFAL